MKFWFFRKKQPPAEGQPPAEDAVSHYLKGNRLLEEKRLGQALTEWRQAWGLWNPRANNSFKKVLLLRLKTVSAFLLTLLLFYQVLFIAFPREQFNMELTLSEGESRSWWERWLDTNRSQPSGGGHKITVREWWERLKERLEGKNEAEKQLAEGKGLRPPVSKRWADLMQRYGQFGPLNTRDMDFSVISGYGLSRLKDYQGAVDALEGGIKKTSKPLKLADLYQGLANAHYYQGYHLGEDGLATYDLKQVKKAAVAYGKSASYQPRALSYGNLGWMHLLLGEYALSEKYSNQALKFNGNLHYVRLNLGLLRVMQGRDWEAFDLYRKVIQSNPAGEVYLGGINDLREVLRDHPGKHPIAYFAAGLLSLKAGQLTDARDFLSRYLGFPQANPNFANISRRLLEGMDTREVER